MLGDFEAVEDPPDGAADLTNTLKALGRVALADGIELFFGRGEEVARYQDQILVSEHYNYDGRTEWAALIRLLEDRGEDYRS